LNGRVQRYPVDVSLGLIAYMYVCRLKIWY
jgi:hypothetical protein